MRASRTSARGRAFAEVRGTPGEWARVKGLLKLLLPMLVMAAATGYLLRASLPVPALRPAAAGWLLVAAGAVTAAWATSGSAKLARYLKGARGEEAVARELGFLPAGYRVFNGIAMKSGPFLPGGCDYDHVVAGPTGLFLVETKNWSGAISIVDGEVLCDGARPDRPPLDQVRAAAAGFRRRLREEAGEDLPVVPILCFAAGRIEGGAQGAQGVMICDTRDVNRVILEWRDSPLAESRIEAVSARIAKMLP